MNARVIIGILVFLGFFTAPFWFNGMSKGLEGAPEPELPEKQEVIAEYGFYKCVEPAEYMRENHMQILDDWRNEVVRQDERTYKSHYNVDDEGNALTFDKSLTRTCLNCHINKKKFCDRCHTYASVKPYCWSCHVIPEERL